MKIVYYQLYHIYEDDKSREDIIKFIGVFSSKKKANDVINNLAKLPGFINYPKNCFQIFKSNVNIYGWKEGFISWNEAD